MISILKSTFVGALIGAAVSSGRHFLVKKSQGDGAISQEQRLLYPNLHRNKPPQVAQLLKLTKALEDFSMFDERLIGSIWKQADRLAALISRIFDKKVESQIRFIKDTYLFTQRLESSLTQLFESLPSHIQSDLVETKKQFIQFLNETNKGNEAEVTLRLTNS